MQSIFFSIIHILEGVLSKELDAAVALLIHVNYEDCNGIVFFVYICLKEDCPRNFNSAPLQSSQCYDINFSFMITHYLLLYSMFT